MSKLVYHVATTLDNFICREDGSIDGFLTEGDHLEDYAESLKGYERVIMGKATYEFGYGFGLKPGTPPYPWMKNYIFSKTIRITEPLDERVIIVRGDAVPFVRKLKKEEGPPIYLCGGGNFAATLLAHQLIDTLIVKLNPILFGKGIRLFGNSQKGVNLTLQESKPYRSGVVLLTYAIPHR